MISNRDNTFNLSDSKCENDTNSLDHLRSASARASYNSPVMLMIKISGAPISNGIKSGLASDEMMVILVKHLTSTNRIGNLLNKLARLLQT